MPWNTEGGGDQGPWGGRNRREQPPNLDEMIRSSQDKFRSMLPKGKSGQSGILILLSIIAIVWIGSGFYRVKEGEQAVVMRFGAYTSKTTSGLRYHLPYPIESVIVQRVDKINRIASDESPVKIRATDLRAESAQPLMLTGDENIVDITYEIQWHISSLEEYLFRARDPADTVKVAAESIIREIISQTPIAEALTTSRGGINIAARERLQKLVDEYKLGITIDSVLLRRVDPPADVIESFRDVQKARTDQERLVNEAQAYKNDIVPIAEGKAIKLIQDGEAYKAAVVANAKANTQRFELLLGEYQKAPAIIKKRLYLETVENILAKADKVIMNDGKSGAQGVLPHLALPALRDKQNKIGVDKK